MLWHPASQEMRALKALLTRLNAVEKDLQRDKITKKKSSSAIRLRLFLLLFNT
jgi:hypothetical protein